MWTRCYSGASFEFVKIRAGHLFSQCYKRCVCDGVYSENLTIAISSAKF